VSSVIEFNYDLCQEETEETDSSNDVVVKAAVRPWTGQFMVDP